MPHFADVLVHLVARKLAAFTGLGPLSHLDLDIVGIDEIFGRDPKPPRSNLLNR